MKIKKIAAVVAAAVMALGMTTMASAGIVDTTVANGSVDGGAFSYDLVAAGISDPASINGQTITITLTVDDSDGFGGGIMANAKSGWKQIEGMYWGNEGQANNTVGSDGTYTLTFTLPSDYDFTAEDLSGEDGTWGQIAVQQWWGNDITITGFQIGSAAAADDAAADDAAATVDKTADVPVAGIVAIALAGCAAVAFAMKKRFA